MKSFSRTINAVGIDLGSSTTRIFADDRVILAESTAVAVNNKDDTVVGFGTDAIIRYHASPQMIRLEWPVQKGSMVDYYLTRDMLRYFLNKALHQNLSRPEIAISIPCELSSVARHALIDALMHAGAQKAYLVTSSVAALLGADIPLDTPDASLSMVIGKDVTDCGLFACGGIVAQEGISFGGGSINNGIKDYLRDTRGLIIGDAEAEEIKQEMITVVNENRSHVVNISGRRLEDGVSVVLEMQESELYPVIYSLLNPVLQLVKRIIRKASPDMAEDLIDSGMLLSGGSARLAGLSGWLSDELGIPVTVPKDPEMIASCGCARVLEDYKNLENLVESGVKYYGGE